MLGHLKNITISARKYFLKLKECCPVRFVKKISWCLLCQNKEEDKLFFHVNIFIIYLTHNGVQIRFCIVDYA